MLKFKAMEKQVEILKANRKGILSLIEGLSIMQLNKVPQGFKNNIAWNVAHLLVTQQLLCYKLSGLPMKVSDDLITRFQKGSTASEFIDEKEFNEIKKRLLTIVDDFMDDYNNNLFKQFTAYTTSANVTLNNLSDAIKFNNFHEGIHFGYMLAMKKSI
jgi:hypothetical protein